MNNFFILFFIVSILSCNVAKKNEATSYKILGTCNKKFELGYDDKYAYLSDLETDEVIAFICEKPDYKYSLEDFIDSTKALARSDMEYNDYILESINSTVVWCKNNSEEQKEIIDNKTRKAKKIYFITYKKAYGMFHE